MAGKKKKKPAANPARGFATVSVASKPKHTGDADNTPDESTAPSRSDVQADLPQTLQAHEAISKHTTDGENDKSIKDMTPDELEQHLELAELQNIVEEHANKVKNDSSKQVVKLLNERRQLRQQAERMSLPGLTDSIVKRVLDRSQVKYALSAQISTTKTAVSNSDNELHFLVDLWTLRVVLEKLQMPNVDDVLGHYVRLYRRGVNPYASEHTPGLDICLEWYAQNKFPSEVPDYITGAISEAEQPAGYMHSGIESDTTDQNVQNPSAGTIENGSELDVSGEASHESTPMEDSEKSENGDIDDPEELIALWLRLRSRKFELEQLTSSGFSTGRLQRMTKRIASIERDMLFDHDTAIQRWQPILMDMQIESGRARKIAAVIRDYKPSRGGISETLEQEILEVEDDDLLGSIFAGDENSSEALPGNNDQVFIATVDYGTWSGVHPRRLLEEVAGDKLKKGSLRFRPLSSLAFSSRLQLDVKWAVNVDMDEACRRVLPLGIRFESMPDRWRLKMQETAARTALQAEALLCTLCLFILLSIDATHSKQLQRLPKIWRETLADLAERRRKITVQYDVDILKNLRQLISSNTSHDTASVVAEKRIDSRSTKEQESDRKIFTRCAPDRVIETWQNRTKSTKYATMAKFRESLPVFKYKDQIVEEFDKQAFLIVCADTGAGKSTQIPSYILEHKMTKGVDWNIMVTQPRRISAISIARRVSEELGEDKDVLGTSRSLVGYAIRMESKISSETRLTFATTGVLLRMLQSSRDLSHLDCLILDEVHERTMDLDLLFIALKKLHQRRPDLKIVLMSATVDSTKFSHYFDNAPVLDVPGRTFPVEVGFLEDAIDATKSAQPLSKVFPTEEKYLPDSDITEEDDIQNDTEAKLSQYSLQTRRILANYDQTRINYDTIVQLAITIATDVKYTAYSNAILIFMPGIGEIRRLHNMLLSSKVFSSKWMVYMLHSSFSTHELEEAFVIPPRGHRKIVIATNIAETGVTIPDITAVIDTCKEKIMRFDERKQLSKLIESFIARASARQRKGRAARVREGLCFHLVTRHRYETKMSEQPIPEMLRLSLQDPILRVKTWNLGAIEDVLSAALDPPTGKNVRRAILRLQEFGALDSTERLTSLGSILAKLPLDVLLGKLAVYGILFQCLDAIVTIIASFGIKSIFIENATYTSPKTVFARGESDFLTTYNAYAGWKKARESGTGSSFCQKYHLSAFQLQQLEEQKVQLFCYLTDARLLALGEDEKIALQRARNVRSAAFQLPSRYDRLSNDIVISAVIAMALHPKLLHNEGNGLRNVYNNQQLYLAPTSVNRSKPPSWVCYLEAAQARSGKLNASHSSRVTQAMIALLLGEAEFKMFSGVIDIDNGRIRLSLRNWKETLVLQGMRSQIQRIVNTFLERPGSPLVREDQEWLEIVTEVLEGSSSSKLRENVTENQDLV